MLRITELKLPLDHSDVDLKNAILKRLGIKTEQLVSYAVFRQGLRRGRSRDAGLLHHALATRA